MLATHTWQSHCPVPIKDLREVKLTYWGYDNHTHQGELIVNKELAAETVKIFSALYQNKFPIQSMKLIETFNGNDAVSMAENNTSAFNCREVTGQPGIFSQHSYGRAIDINPLFNPYVKGEEILPVSNLVFVDRNIALPGKINKKSVIYQIFIKYNWDWGGNWLDLQDYQHFEKRAHGEKRDIHGYTR